MSGVNGGAFSIWPSEDILNTDAEQFNDLKAIMVCRIWKANLISLL